MARLQGIMPQPNPLGWIAAASLVLEWGPPFPDDATASPGFSWLAGASTSPVRARRLSQCYAGFVFLVGRPSVATGAGRRIVASAAALAVVLLLVAGERAGEGGT